MEGRIAAWVAEGRTVREIAGLTGQTEGTVRWHLHQIYHKHGLTGQVALVRLVLAGGQGHLTRGQGNFSVLDRRAHRVGATGRSPLPARMAAKMAALPGGDG